MFLDRETVEKVVGKKLTDAEFKVFLAQAFLMKAVKELAEEVAEAKERG